jgi:hypothetical protein
MRHKPQLLMSERILCLAVLEVTLHDVVKMFGLWQKGLPTGIWSPDNILFIRAHTKAGAGLRELELPAGCVAANFERQ